MEKEMTHLHLLRCTIAILAVAFASLFAPFAHASESADQRVITQWVANNSHASVDENQASRIVRAAYKAAAQWNVDPLLLLAVMKPESNFQAKARNPRSNASCLMQIIPRWHRDKIGRRQIMNVETCVDVGAAIIAEYLSLTNGKLQKAIYRYSGGAGKAYEKKIAQAYRDMKSALVLDRFVAEREHRSDHIFYRPEAYSASLIADRPKSAYVKNPADRPEVVLVASHP
jgi:soluble lytic murein transglycosylase-like protein